MGKPAWRGKKSAENTGALIHLEAKQSCGLQGSPCPAKAVRNFLGSSFRKIASHPIPALSV